MEIRLQKIVPTYFEKSEVSGSEVWNKEVSFKKGEHVHIIAPSGSGKTSLIHFIYGLRRDYEGVVFYDSRDIIKFSNEDFSSYRKNKISIVFQDLRLFPEQTVKQNIEIKRQLDPFHPAEKIKDMANRLGIEKKLGNAARTCSYGEQQRIAIIRSLMQPFDIILLDEPFSHLDDANRDKALVLIAEECEARNASMIFVDLKHVEFFKDDIILRL